MTRVVPILVSFMGSLGLALSVGYLLLVVRAFQPGGAEVTEFLVGKSDGAIGWGFTIVLVPYTLLLVHMWWRIRLGDWLLLRGAVDEAEAYAARRVRRNLLRDRKEILAHRVTLMRVHIRRLEYEKAADVAREVTRLGRPHPWQTQYRRWQLELALRREDLVEANEIVGAVGAVRERSPEAAAFLCAAAELAVREGNAELARERIDSADWAFSRPHPRRHVVEALKAAKFESADHAVEDALVGLESALPWLIEVPGAEGELLACRAQLVNKGGDAVRAAALLRESECVCDSRSSWALEQAKQELDDGGQG